MKMSLEIAVIQTAEQQEKMREFVERVKAALCNLAEALKKAFEQIKKYLAECFAKSEPPKSKGKARFPFDKGKNPQRFNNAAYGRRHNPP